MTSILELTAVRRLHKAFITIFLVALCGVGGQAAAAVQGPGDLGVLSVPSGTLIGNSGLSGDFDDVYSFQVLSDASFGSRLVSVSFNNIYNIKGFATSLWQGGVELAKGTFQTVSSGGYDVLVSTLSYTPLAPNLQFDLLVQGSSNGMKPGYYAGAIALKPVLTPVPEPEVYAMLLAGLGIMGWAAKARARSRIAV